MQDEEVGSNNSRRSNERQWSDGRRQQGGAVGGAWL